MKATLLALTLERLLSQTGLSVYAEGEVPEGASYPYVAWSARILGRWDDHTVSVSCLTQHDYQGCLSMAETLRRLIPDAGLLVPMGCGYALFWVREGSVRREKLPGHITACHMELGMRLYEAEDEEAMQAC